MKKIVVNIIVLVMLIITTPLVLLLWGIIRVCWWFVLITNVKTSNADCWKILDKWDEWLYSQINELID